MFRIYTVVRDKRIERGKWGGCSLARLWTLAFLIVLIALWLLLARRLGFAASSGRWRRPNIWEIWKYSMGYVPEAIR